MFYEYGPSSYKQTLFKFVKLFVLEWKQLMNTVSDKHNVIYSLQQLLYPLDHGMYYGSNRLHL